MAGMNELRIPVTLLTGFLGSGKTTVLNRMIATAACERAAVVVNELGEIAIDPLLITSPVDQVVVLDNGCICCSARGDLAGALRRLAHFHASSACSPFDRVVVETTGLADPVPLMETLCEDADMAERFHGRGVITTVDAVNGCEQMRQFVEPVKQAAAADQLFITKCDLATPGQIIELKRRLRAVNPGAAILQSDARATDIDTTWAKFFSSGHDETLDWVTRAEVISRQHGGKELPHVVNDAEIRHFSVVLDQTATRAGLVLWLDKLAGLKGPQLLRVKGLLNVEGQAVAVHAVQRIVHEPLVLPRWPDADRRSRLVFITHGLSRATIEATLDTLGFRLGANPGRLIDPEAYARFVQASDRFR